MCYKYFNCHVNIENEQRNIHCIYITKTLFFHCFVHIGKGEKNAAGIQTGFT